jgi:predicted ester cyclase
MSIEKNKEIVRRLIIDVIEQGHVEFLDEFCAPDDSKSNIRTIQGWKDIVFWAHRVAPGFKGTIRDMIAEGDNVVCCIRWDLTFQTAPYPDTGPWPPMGKQVSWDDVLFIRFVNGKMLLTREVSELTDALVNVGAYTMTGSERS